MNNLMRPILLLCVLWLSGCDSIYTTNPIADGNTPVDERLIGMWVSSENPDESGVLNIQKIDESTNELAVISLGGESCDVMEGRVVQLSDYWIFEFDVDHGPYSCVSPHETPESGEVKDEDTLKESGNRYDHIAYKILKWNDSTSASLIWPDENISEANQAIATISKYYKLGETPSVLVASTLKPELFAQQISEGKMKGSIKGLRSNYSLDRVWCANRTTWWASLSESSCVEDGGTVFKSKLEAQGSIEGASDWYSSLEAQWHERLKDMESLDVTVTDSPEVVRAYLSSLYFFEDMDSPLAVFIRVQQSK